jgi:hypothetical protein
VKLLVNVAEPAEWAAQATGPVAREFDWQHGTDKK